MTTDFYPETAEVLDEAPIVTASNGNDESQDIDAISWLAGEAERSAVVGFYEFPDGRRLKIAPVTEAEDNLLIRQSYRPIRGKVQLDYLLHRRRYVAFSLSKADPSHKVDESQLSGALSGNLTQLQKAITLLSGGEITRPEMPDPFGSST